MKAKLLIIVLVLILIATMMLPTLPSIQGQTPTKTPPPLPTMPSPTKTPPPLPTNTPSWFEYLPVVEK